MGLSGKVVRVPGRDSGVAESNPNRVVGPEGAAAMQARKMKEGETLGQLVAASCRSLWVSGAIHEVDTAVCPRISGVATNDGIP